MGLSSLQGKPRAEDKFQPLVLDASDASNILQSLLFLLPHIPDNDEARVM